MAWIAISVNLNESFPEESMLADPLAWAYFGSYVAFKNYRNIYCSSVEQFPRAGHNILPYHFKFCSYTPEIVAVVAGCNRLYKHLHVCTL